MALRTWNRCGGRPVVALLLLVAAGLAAAQESPDAETAREQALARAAEAAAVSGVAAVPPRELPSGDGSGGGGPLFIGVDDTGVATQRVDVVTNAFTPAFSGFQVWGAAYDPDDDQVYFNNGSTLYVWPVGGTPSLLGTILDAAGAPQAFVGLAFYNARLYGTKNIANEAIWGINPNTLVATVVVDYVDDDLDCGGFAIDPADGAFYCTNDDPTPYGAGLVRIDPDASVTLVTPYPAGETDIDGLAIGNGRAYLVIDEPGPIFVWDFTLGAYLAPLVNPWISTETFAAGAWIPPGEGGAASLQCDGPTIGFEGGAFPADWSVTSLALPGGEWVVSTDNSSTFWNPGPAPEGIFYASANDDLPGSASDGSADYLYTNVFSLGGAATAELDFFYHFNGAFGQAAGGVEVSGNGGASWDGELVLPVGASWQSYALDLSAYVGNPTVRVRFHSNDGGSWAAGYGIDAVALTCGGGSACVITPPPDMTVPTDPDQCGALVDYPPPTTSGQCGPVTCTPAAGTSFPPGTTTVTCSDTSGRTATFDVTVVDQQPPSLTAPDLAVDNDPGLCSAVVAFAVTPSDNCPGVGSPVCTPPPGFAFPVGVTAVTCTATDAAGNVGSDDGAIAVSDVEPPTLTPPNVVVGNDPGLCAATVAFTPAVSDNCPGSSASCVPPSGSSFPVGVSPLACVATDASGNSTNGAGSVAVNDVEPPVITCPADIELDLPPGSTGQNVAYDPPTVSDNCGVVYDCQPPSGDVFPAGQTPVTCTAQDPASNTAQCGFLITLGALTVLEVPTVSSLGLLALALLLAAAAFVALRRSG